MSTDLRTSITAVVTGIMGLLSYFGIVIPEAWTLPIVSIGVVLIGLFAADGKKKDA